jgi:xanthine/CO dehydrogenase XdhC/CoxF family maturation factor
MIGVRVDRTNSHDVAAVSMGQGCGGQPTVSVWRLHMPQILAAFADFQFHGSSSSSRLIGCPSTMHWSTSCRYA